MSRRASTQSSLAHAALFTPLIIEGRLSRSNYPGTPIFAANCRELSRAYHLSRGGKKLEPAARLFGAVERYTKILHEVRDGQHKVVPYLIDVAGRNATWIRQPEDFRPRTSRGKDQLVELVRYLFESYRVPSWLRRAIAPKRGRPARAPAFGWYVHLAQGRNLRSAPELPLRLTRRAAHEALSAPARFRPQHALLYGCLQATNTPRRVRDELLGAARSCDIKLDDASLGLFEKIARAPEITYGRVLPLLVYAERKRAEGASLDLPLRALLRDMARLEAERREIMARQRAAQYGALFDERWRASLPQTRASGSCEQGEFIINELRTYRELFEEGQAMRHCVFTYAAAARAGSISIWSLRITRAGVNVGRVTVRVAASERAVVEARGYCNQNIQPHERELLRSWALSQGLSLATSV